LKKRKIQRTEKKKKKKKKKTIEICIFSSSLHSVPSQLRSLCPLLCHHRAQSATDIGSLFETNRLNYTGLAAIFFLFREKKKIGKERKENRKNKMKKTPPTS